MPYPNEHSCRLVNPNQCKDGSFRRENGGGEYNGKAFDIIWAERKSDGETVRQAHRYPTSSFSEADARKHCNSLDSIKFEPASNQSADISRVMYQPWAISRQGLETVKHAADNVGSMQAVMARAGERLNDETVLTKRRGDVAVIEVIGPIFHYENIITMILGLPSNEGIMQEIQSALDDPQISSIVLQIDSPGGQLGGTNELAGFIRSQNKKPIYSYVGDLAASAAYWIASATDEVVMEETARAGSIGVVLNARRKSDDSMEIVSTVSPKKRPDPGSDEGLQQLQERVDDIANVFVQTVASNRGLSEEAVTALEGNVVIASKAIEAGLADRTGSLEELIAELQNQKSDGGTIMDLKTLQTEHAELYEQVKEEGRSEARHELESAKEEARKEAREGVLSMTEVVLGQDAKAKLDEVLQAGLTAEQVKVSQKLFGAQEPQGGQGASGGGDAKQQILEGLEKQTPPPAGHAEAGGDSEPQDFEQAVQEHQKAQNCSRGEAIKAVAEQYPQLHEAWIEKHQNQ